MAANIENKIQEFITLRDTSADFVSSLAQIAGISGASSSRLSQAFRGRPLPVETAGPLGKLLDDVDAWVESLQPLPIALRNPVTILNLVTEFKARQEETARPTPFQIVTVGPALFKQVVGDRVETCTDYSQCAAFPITVRQDRQVANLVAKMLDQMTSEHIRVTTITNERRSPESFSHKLSDVGFTS